MPSIEAMTDEALLTACRRLRWERRLESAGCGLSLAIGILAAVGTFLLFGGQAWVGALMAFVGVGILLNVGIDYSVNFRSGRHQAELRRRYRLQELPQASADAEHFFRGDDPPDTVLLLQGWGLPHGNQHFIKVRLWQAHLVRATLHVQTMSRIDFRREVPFTAEKGEVELFAAECARLLVLLPEVEKADATEIGSTVIDGFPCTLVVLRREPFTMGSFFCNLAGVPEASADHPAPLMMTAVMELSERVTKQPLVFGWCDPYGNIGVGGA